MSTGTSEPLPLPTTIIGALLGSKPGEELDGANVAIGKRLGCGEAIVLRGPYYPWREGVAIHVYPKSLLLIDNAGRVRSLNVVEMIVHRGTALNRRTKSVMKGLLYSTQLIDPEKLVEVGIVPEISIDILCRACAKRRVTKFGGEMRVALLDSDEDAKLVKIIASLASETRYFVVASPILLDMDAKTELEKLLRGKEAEIDGCILRAPSVEDARRAVGEGDLVKRLRVRVEVLSPGVYSDTGLPRRPYLAILPGSLLWIECSNTTKFLQGIGRYHEIGFGTVVPITLHSTSSTSR